LNLTGKQPKIRKLSAPNAYSKLYFATKIKPVVEERWEKKYLEKNPQHKPGDKIPHWRIPFQNAILHELWNAEPEDVKNDVRRQFGLNDDDSEGELESAEPDEAEEDRDGSDRAELERVERLKSYQRCVSPIYKHPYANDPHSSNIEALNDTMMTALREIERKTGFIGTVLLAGPEPAQGGNITVVEFVDLTVLRWNRSDSPAF
jgi:hypothetical protein